MQILSLSYNWQHRFGNVQHVQSFIINSNWFSLIELAYFDLQIYHLIIDEEAKFNWIWMDVWNE